MAAGNSFYTCVLRPRLHVQSWDDHSCSTWRAWSFKLYAATADALCIQENSNIFEFWKEKRSLQQLPIKWKWLGQASLLDSRLSADEWLTGERAQEQLLEENVGNVLSWSTPMAVVSTAPSVCRSCCEDFSKVTIVITRTIVLPNG